MPSEASAQATSKSASKKKRKSKKKAADKSSDNNGEAIEARNGAEEEQDDGEVEGDEDDVQPSRNASIVEPTHTDAALQAPNEEQTEQDIPIRNGSSKPAEAGPPVQDEMTTSDAADSDTLARLEAMAKDRDSLQAEVAELRKSLEDIQGKHEEELSGLRKDVDEAQSGQERAEEQYRALLGKVNTIRSQLGERLKADAADLSQARAQIEELQEQNSDLQSRHDEKESELQELTKQTQAHGEEISQLRNRSDLSTTNWSRERDDLNTQLAYAREEFENAKQAMQDWEVLAMEERSQRENFGDRVGELEEQLATVREAYERVADERDGQNSTVDGLQRALQEIQEARRRELREIVENSEKQLETLRKQADESAQKASNSATQLESAQKELERYIPFEKEVKEKNLLIGKLRHEAVILNDHLTKALRFLKRGKPEDNVDRQIVTNHFLHFLALDRSDPKKFQILQLIAALLGWTEEQREQAGLARPGASNIALRVPLSPFRRTPSTPGLSSDFSMSPNGTSKESLAELWSEFLEREAQQGGADSRRGSNATNTGRSVSVTSPGGVMSPGTQPLGAGLGIRAASSGNMNGPQSVEKQQPQ